MRFFFSLILICFAPAAFAQADSMMMESDDTTPVSEDKDSVRRYFIKSFPEYFFIYPVLKQRSLNFEVAKADRSSVLTYKPNNTYSLGVGAYIFELGVELAFAIPLREQSLERFGESEARDIGLNVLSKRWGVDAFYQRYNGFYLLDREREPLPDELYPQRPDIKTKSFGFTGHYVFNHQKFSFRSVYNFSERQLYSRGSFLLFSSLYTFRVASDSSIIKGDRRAQFGSGVDFTRLRYTTFSIAPGYTYNLTYNNFFLNTTLAIGPAHHWLNYDLENSPIEHYDIAINTFFGARVAIGYNGYKMFGGISFISQGSRLKFSDVTFANNNSVFKILVGYRFNEVGLLKKRVLDILPFDL